MTRKQINAMLDEHAPNIVQKMYVAEWLKANTDYYVFLEEDTLREVALRKTDLVEPLLIKGK